MDLWVGPFSLRQVYELLLGERIWQDGEVLCTRSPAGWFRFHPRLELITRRRSRWLSREETRWRFAEVEYVDFRCEHDGRGLFRDPWERYSCLLVLADSHRIVEFFSWSGRCQDGLETSDSGRMCGDLASKVSALVGVPFGRRWDQAPDDGVITSVEQ